MMNETTAQIMSILETFDIESQMAIITDVKRKIRMRKAQEIEEVESHLSNLQEDLGVIDKIVGK